MLFLVRKASSLIERGRLIKGHNVRKSNSLIL